MLFSPNRKSKIEDLKLLNHLLRPHEHYLWNRQAESFGGLKIDHQLKLLRFRHWHELSHFAVQFLGDVLVFEPHLRPQGNLLAFQVAAQLEHVAAPGIPRFALFCAGVKAVFQDASPERGGERLRIPDQE